MNNNKKRIVALISVAIVSILGNSCTPEDITSTERGGIYGYVTDFQTGDAVENANVSLRHDGHGGEATQTGLDGMYEFRDLEDGNYSITVSKAEYTDLVDPYVIQVKNGKRMRRDVQIKKLPATIRIVDANGHDMSTLDFGAETSIVTKTLYIFNNGTISVDCHAEYRCDWIESVSTPSDNITPGQTIPISVTIKRQRLAKGQNSTILAFVTPNGSSELTVLASSATGNPPEVQLSQVNNVTATTAQCEGQIVNTHGGSITDCGFCYSAYHTPSLNDEVVRLGPNSGTFNHTILNLEHNTAYHIRAFAVSNLGTGYSAERIISTMSCIPICGATTIENIDPSAVMGYSEVTNGNGCSIIDKGLCWSANHTPTIHDNTASSGFGEGTIINMLYPLQPNTTYRVRSYATNEYTTTYGPEMTFTTISGIPTVTTASASFTEYYYSDYILTGGNVTDVLGTSIGIKGVCYGFNPNPDLSSSFQHTEDDFGSGPFTSYIPMPSRSGYLYIRAYATSPFGTGYGNQVTIYIP
ncbi:MAG: carboxypeptidase regulatory-like domain-containing protein [Bacteroidales bacterium]|nr:carboxypeptidase regulatory-like domain-containing protein [Bacteroidales bacterium]